MARKSTPLADYKKLFALSGNVCAYPSCTHPLINNDGVFIAEMCHIEAANKGGERYNSNMNDIERASADNLMLMCHRHHVETNNENDFTVDKLKKIKKEHEDLYRENTYSIKENVLYKILDDEKSFWMLLSNINTKHLENEELGIELDTESDLLGLCNELEKSFNFIDKMAWSMYGDFDTLPNDIILFMKSLGYDTEKIEKIPYYENPFDLKHWETFNIGYSNITQKIEYLIISIKLRYLLKLANKTKEEHFVMAELKIRLEHIARTALVTD